MNGKCVKCQAMGPIVWADLCRKCWETVPFREVNRRVKTKVIIELTGYTMDKSAIVFETDMEMPGLKLGRQRCEDEIRQALLHAVMLWIGRDQSSYFLEIVEVRQEGEQVVEYWEFGT